MARCHEAVSGEQSGPTGRSTPIHDAYAWEGAMPMGAAGQQTSMRSDARVSGEYATKGLLGERIESILDSNVKSLAVTKF